MLTSAYTIISLFVLLYDSYESYNQRRRSGESDFILNQKRLEGGCIVIIFICKVFPTPYDKVAVKSGWVPV